MSEFDFRPTRSTRFGTTRAPGFRSVPAGTGNIPPPAAAAPSLAPAGPLDSVFAEGFDDSLDLDTGPAGGSAGVTGAGAGVAGSEEPSFGLDFDLADALLGGLQGAGKGALAAGPLGAIVGGLLGTSEGFTVTGENIGVETAAQPESSTTTGLATGTTQGTDPQGISVTREGTGVVSSGDSATGVGGVTESEAQGFGDVESDPGGFGTTDAEAEAGDTGGVGGGGDGGGDAGGGAGDAGDEGGDDPERAGGPVVANRPGGTVGRTAHDGEFVLQAGPTQALGEDALNMLNSGRFDPARVRAALGMAAQPGASFSGPSVPRTALGSVRG